MQEPKETAKKISDMVLDAFEYQGRTIREWVKIILTSDDLISRQEALDGVREYIAEYSDLQPNGEHNWKWCAMQEAEDLILNLPSLSEKLKRGDKNERNSF